ncbi:uncharacterized protein LOC119310613 [Triticum dicoccoides]|uniref:uncharacterized protein LOC119310613 n=1 Tax=Triticum dicoccoides TaxID=85692 RepID=UPI001891D1C4|nr:uncharacterized protein LOC119310613 [Triticum dicoccoides]
MSGLEVKREDDDSAEQRQKEWQVDNAEDNDGCWSIQIPHATSEGFLESRWRWSRDPRAARRPTASAPSPTTSSSSSSPASDAPPPPRAPPPSPAGGAGPASGPASAGSSSATCPSPRSKRRSAPPPAVSLLQIRITDKRLPEHSRPDSARVNSLLLAAARLQPEELAVALPSGLIHGTLALDHSCFQRTTSIVLDIFSVLLLVPAGVEFPALQKLSLLCCHPDLDLGSFIPCCPRLRTLWLDGFFFQEGVLSIDSASLQELVVDSEKGLAEHINIVAPMLKRFTMSFVSSGLSISVLAPMLDKVSWRCCYTRHSVWFGIWRLKEVLLRTADTQGQLLSLRIHLAAGLSFPNGEEGTFTHEIEKHMIANFSVLELYITREEHVYGAPVFHLLGMNQIRSAMQKLKVTLPGPAARRCSQNCRCRQPMGWRSQTISLTALEEVEINGFQGDCHELDVLKLIFRCAPMLKRMIVKLSYTASNSYYRSNKLFEIPGANSSVEFYVYLNSGLRYYGPKFLLS